MKKCPFCLETIPEEALKCSHCGEWVTKKPNAFLGSIGQVIDQSKNLVKGKIDEYKENRNKHLFVPDDENPIEIQGHSFYGSYVISNNVKIPYSEIVSLYFTQGKVSYNLITETSISFVIFFSLEDQSFPLEKRFNKRVIGLSSSYYAGIKSKKVVETIRLIYSLLCKATYELRLKQYQDMVKNNMFFYYPDGYKIHKNWDISKNDKVVANLRDAYENQLIEYGTHSSGLRSSSSNPNCLMIHKSKGLKFSLVGGVPLFSQTSIDVVYDKDVFDYFYAQLR